MAYCITRTISTRRGKDYRSTWPRFVVFFFFYVPITVAQYSLYVVVVVCFCSFFFFFYLMIWAVKYALPSSSFLYYYSTRRVWERRCWSHQQLWLTAGTNPKSFPSPLLLLGRPSRRHQNSTQIFLHFTIILPWWNKLSTSYVWLIVVLAQTATTYQKGGSSLRQYAKEGAVREHRPLHR